MNDSADDIAILCRGDNYNIKCPYCGKNNHYVCQGQAMEFGKVTFFTKPCCHCKKTVYYQAKYEIAVIAEKTDLSKGPPKSNFTPP